MLVIVHSDALNYFYSALITIAKRNHLGLQLIPKNEWALGSHTS